MKHANLLLVGQQVTYIYVCVYENDINRERTRDNNIFANLIS